VLASASPRRRELLGLLGIPFTVRPVDIDETQRPEETPEALVRRLAGGKAAAGAVAVAADASGPVVIGADTIVVADGQVLGKPADDGDARRMLGLLSGRSHRVLTGVVVRIGGSATTAVEETAVAFCELTAADIDWYLASGEHRGKAGAYGIQGVAGVFVTRIEGSFTNVVGLPLATLRPMLAATGFRV